MKLIHLSDLHIGKRVNEISMLEDQRHILDGILAIVDGEQPDAVLLCGDIYDKTVPPAEAVTLFDSFLCSLCQRKVPVLIISGNHDSPERLSFGGRLMEGSGVHIAPVYDGQVRSVTLQDCHGEVRFWLLPFIKPAHVRRFFPGQSIESYTEAVGAVIASLPLDPGGRNVLLTHQFVTGAATCDSEELSVGGSDNVDLSVFAPFDYVALGHIHGPQSMDSGRIRYSGTPLKYSFSEENHHKSVTVVRLGAKGELSLSLQPLVPRHDLRTLRGSFLQLTDRSFYAGTAADDYLRIVLTDEEEIPEAIGRLRVIYPNIMELRYDNTRTRTDRTVDGPAEAERMSPLELFDRLYEQQNNQPMSPQQRSYMQTVIQQIQEAEL